MIYEYNCKRGHHFERILPVAEYQTPQTCDCGAKARKIISLPAKGIVKQNVCYDSPIDGRPITSYAQRREDLARNNCQEYDPEMRKDADNFRKREEAKLDKVVDETVEAAIEKMPSRKKESLERELSSGADIELVRTSI